MARFSTLQFALRDVGGVKKAGKRKKSQAFSDYEDSLELLNSNFSYVDPLSGDPKNVEYYQNAIEAANIALTRDLTEVERNKLDLARRKFEADSKKLLIEESKPILEQTSKEIEDDIDRSLSQALLNRTALDKEAFSGAAILMEQRIANEKAELEALLNATANATIDQEVVKDIRRVIDIYDKKEVFFRRVANSPSDFRIDILNNSKGEAFDIKFRDIHDEKSDGVVNTGQQLGGYTVFARPSPSLSDDEGEKMKIGNTLLVRDPGTSQWLPSEEGATLSGSSINIVDDFNLGENEGLIAPNGYAYIKNADGNYIKMNQSFARKDLDTSNFVFRKIDEDSASALEGGFRIEKIDDKSLRRDEIVKRHEADMENYLSSVSGQYLKRTPEGGIARRAAVSGQARALTAQTPAPDAPVVRFSKFLREKPSVQAVEEKVSSATASAGKAVVGAGRFLKTKAQEVGAAFKETFVGG